MDAQVEPRPALRVFKSDGTRNNVFRFRSSLWHVRVVGPNDTLTDDEEGDKGGRHETIVRPRSLSFGRADGWVYLQRTEPRHKTIINTHPRMLRLQPQR